MRFNFDEFERIPDSGPIEFAGDLVFDNGWQLKLRFRDVQVTRALPLTVPTEYLPATVSGVSLTQTA